MGEEKKEWKAGERVLQPGDLCTATKLVHGLRPPVAGFRPIDGLTEQEGEEFIAFIRKTRREDVECVTRELPTD